MMILRSKNPHIALLKSGFRASSNPSRCTAGQLKDQKRNILLLGISIFVLLTNCKNKKDEIPHDSAVPESFWQFYDQFHRDSMFQLNHITFPLEGVPAVSDSTYEKNSFSWTQSEWKMHRPYDDMEGTFQREFQTFQGIVTERITDHSGNFRMVRRFTRIQGEWHLIYYEAMGRVE